ncbi:MAG: peptidoglycan DD-metalloendopeptidase family protein [Bacteroidales bacterium]|nr:peptidoglycan DD-metalloendopeptidase family protein [Bacteroidales bacterium]MBR5782531.1 peptidoglycan DD-metalloendopeptidase family protein [Bacteroidales bacterium]
MVKNNKILIPLLFFFLISLSGRSQSVQSLEKKIQSIQKDIKLAEKLLKETSKDKETTINQVALLQTQINQRESLIKTYQNQVNAINKEIQKNKNNISALEKDIALYRKEYSNLLVINYRNKGKVNNLLFIFSSEDFNQAMRRMRYLQELNDMLKDKIDDISSTQTKINTQLAKNEKHKKEIEKILDEEKKEKATLVKERDKLNKDIASLKKKESQIQKDIKKKENETKALKKEIEKIIAEEIRKAKEREEAAKKNNGKPVDYKLSSNFAQNKGKLPYPVEQGIIIGKYGLSQHPTQKKVTVNNNGIDISTIKGAKARSVFEGEVCFITSQGGNNVILIRHGLYFTLYSNLEKVFVRVGDKVTTGQEIGRIHTNVSDGKTILHFEIWQENRTTVNPALWIMKN